MWKAFLSWYERTYTLNVSIALGLFLLQIIHLIWLSGEVVWFRAFGESLFTLSGVHKAVIILVDYTEIPALISVSLLYINELRGAWSVKNILYLGFLNIQWVHLFWITDEFVVASFTGSVPVLLPLSLAWVAIGIDYLEVPVMIDVLKKFVHSVRDRRVGDFLKHELR